ncbi:hypothetical protein COCNU_16G000670 [Cocos nucifera]|uniref:Uncharacterized protein n=1 Tax=Cocos nucifera TaxID=13894 RepID=A0A8K0IXM1_COCNU|nr:hypothetical protein COCNU_16G000670 [Cocos nucifera]
MVGEPSLGPPPSSNSGIGGGGCGRDNTSHIIGKPSLRPPPSSSDPPSLKASIPRSYTLGPPSDPPCGRTPSMPHDPSLEGASDERIAQEHMDLSDDGRTLITITSDRRFYPDTVTRWISNLIRTHVSCLEITFRKWLQAAKDLVFQQFMDVYKFRKRDGEVSTRQVFEKCASDRLSDILSDKRRKAKERKQTDNIADYMLPMTLVYMLEMKETKQPVTIKEIYDRTHERKNREYVSEKAKSMIVCL